MHQPSRFTAREIADVPKRYDAGLRGSNGRVITRSFRRRRNAERWHRDQCAARGAGTWVDQRLGRQRLDEWFEEWWATRTELRPSTIARDESLYRNHVLAHFGDLTLSSIDYPLVTAWAASLRERGLAPATVRRCHLLLSKLLASSVKANRSSRRTDRHQPDRVRGALIEGRPKTAAGVRTVPLPRREP